MSACSASGKRKLDEITRCRIVFRNDILKPPSFLKMLIHSNHTTKKYNSQIGLFTAPGIAR